MFFNINLFNQIAYLLNSIAMTGKSTDELADFIVLNFPMEWVCVLGEGVYQRNLSGKLGDTALVCLDIVQLSLDIKNGKRSSDIEYSCIRNGEMIYDHVSADVVVKFLGENDPGDVFVISKYVDGESNHLFSTAVEIKSL